MLIELRASQLLQIPGYTGGSEKTKSIGEKGVVAFFNKEFNSIYITQCLRSTGVIPAEFFVTAREKGNHQN